MGVSEMRRRAAEAEQAALKNTSKASGTAISPEPVSPKESVPPKPALHIVDRDKLKGSDVFPTRSTDDRRDISPIGLEKKFEYKETPAPAPDPEKEVRRQEAERNYDNWRNPQPDVYLNGSVTTEPRELEEYNFRRGLGRWFYSFIHGVPFPIHRHGRYFTLRSDDIERMERTVIVYGNIVGGYIHKDSKVRVRGRIDSRSGSLIAEEILTDTESMVINGCLSANVVRLLTFAALSAATVLSYFIVIFATGAFTAGRAFFQSAVTDVPEAANRAINDLDIDWAKIFIVIAIALFLFFRIRGRLRRFRRRRRRRW